MSEIKTVRDWHTAHGNIQRKLNIAGIDYDNSVMTMVEDAKQTIIRLRREKAAMWELLKVYSRDRLRSEDNYLAEIAQLEKRPLPSEVRNG